MDNYKRIEDVEVFKTIEKLVNKEETSEDIGTEVVVTKLKLLLDIRQFLRKIYKNMPKKVQVYKQPTGKKSDVIVGEGK